MCDVMDSKLVEREIVVRTGQRRRWWQDHISVARCLIEVNIHAHHVLERAERLLQAMAIGSTERGIAGKRD